VAFAGVVSSSASGPLNPCSGMEPARGPAVRDHGDDAWRGISASGLAQRNGPFRCSGAYLSPACLPCWAAMGLAFGTLGARWLLSFGCMLTAKPAAGGRCRFSNEAPAMTSRRRAPTCHAIALGWSSGSALLVLVQLLGWGSSLRAGLPVQAVQRRTLDGMAVQLRGQPLPLRLRRGGVG